MSFLPATEKDLSRIVQSVRELWQGRSTATGSFSLATGVTHTDVDAQNCGPNSVITLIPLTAHAANMWRSNDCYVSSVTNGQFTVHHASTANADCTYGYQIQG